ncbi:MAG: hypothetical protein KF878_32960 [Planctomycetes bacterium]|nr:hypothetical protein [Planctomycetota bacterium]
MRPRIRVSGRRSLSWRGLAPIAAAALLGLGVAAPGALAEPPLARTAAAVAGDVARAGDAACAGARAPGASLVAIRPNETVMAGRTKIVFGQVSMAEVVFSVQDKRPRRVEVLGLGGNSFVLLVPPRATLRVPVPPGFGPPLAMRVEPAPSLPPTLVR